MLHQIRRLKITQKKAPKKQKINEFEKRSKQVKEYIISI